MKFDLYTQYPRTSDEHVPLSSHCGPSSGLFTGLLVDTNLDTSSPDAYRSPPAPILYDVSVGHPNTPLVTQEICVNKNDAVMQTTNSDSIQEAGGGNNQDPPAKCEDLKDSDCKAQANFEVDATKELEVELSKSMDSVGLTTEEEDACPICLEGNLHIIITFVFYTNAVKGFGPATCTFLCILFSFRLVVVI